MPKAKPVSLFPLSFEEAITALIRVDPTRVALGKSRQKQKAKATKKK